MGLLDGRTVIITGASSGVGEAGAYLFANEGANVVLTARRARRLEEICERIADRGGKASFIAGDLTDTALHEALVAEAVRRFGALDAAFNNAGDLGALASTAELTDQGWRETIELNLTGHFLAARTQIPALLESGHGSLIFTSSFVGPEVGFPSMAAYAAAKAGLVGLMRVISSEYAPMGLRANAILSGGIDTPMGRESANSPEAMDFVKSLHALKRIAAPEEIANAALYLASDLSSFVTGTAHAVEGGVTTSRT